MGNSQQAIPLVTVDRTTSQDGLNDKTAQFRDVNNLPFPKDAPTTGLQTEWRPYNRDASSGVADCWRTTDFTTTTDEQKKPNSKRPPFTGHIPSNRRP